VDVTVTSVRMSFNAPANGRPLPLHGSLAMVDPQAKLDEDLRTSSSLGTHAIKYAQDHYPLLGWLLWRLSLLTSWPFWW
jgi:hypothetical protein